MFHVIYFELSHPVDGVLRHDPWADQPTTEVDSEVV
jgi:hypothetical protein